MDEALYPDQPEGKDHGSGFGQSSGFRFRFWYHCVDEYNRRALTKPTDELPAIAGLATKFHRCGVGDYLAGLWESDLFRGLAWYGVAALSSIASAAVAHSKRRVTALIRASRYRALSWSWADYDGCVLLFNRLWDYRVGLSQYHRWSIQFGPPLVSHRILHATSSPYMDVL
jgi:hypothetical protein